MLYTGYFAKTKKYEEAGLTPVSVALVTPLFFKGPKWSFFAPRKQLLDAYKADEITQEQFSTYYTNNLEATINTELQKKLRYTIGKHNIVMLCYEKSGDFCHRKILADWLIKKLDIKVDEYTI